MASQLRIVSFNIAAPCAFMSDEQYRNFLGKPVESGGLCGILSDDTPVPSDVVCLQEHYWVLTRNNPAAFFAGWGVHSSFYVFGSAVHKETAVLVKKNSGWTVERYYGVCLGDQAGMADLPIESFTGFIGPSQDNVRRAVEGRIVVVQLKSAVDDSRVFVLSYHGLYKSITDNTANANLNVLLLKGILLSSRIVLQGNDNVIPVILAADLNPPRVRSVERMLQDNYTDRGIFYLPTTENGQEKHECIDAFYIAADFGNTIVASARPGAKIVLPSEVGVSGVAFDQDTFSYVLMVNGSLQRHTHLAYALELMISTPTFIYNTLSHTERRLLAPAGAADVNDNSNTVDADRAAEDPDRAAEKFSSLTLSPVEGR